MTRLDSRIDGRDDGADGFLVEAFEAAFALEVFQVAADGAFGNEFCELGVVDEMVIEEPLGALAAHGPTFAFGEGLLEEVEITERLHRLDPGGGELFAAERIIKTRLQVVHARFEKTFAV